MAAAELIASGATAATSSDIELADGNSIIVAVEGADDRAEVAIELKGTGSNWISVRMLSRSEPAWSVVGPATYRARRVAGGTCGVFSA